MPGALIGKKLRGQSIKWARVRTTFATVSKIGHFRFLHWRPSWLSCINEYLAIYSGGHVSDLVVARNCCMVRTLPGEAELLSEWTGLSGRATRVKRFERSNGLDTALYKNYLCPFPPFDHLPSPRLKCPPFPPIFVLSDEHSALSTVPNITHQKE